MRKNNCYFVNELAEKANSINGLKFNDTVERRTSSKSDSDFSEFISNINKDLEALYGKNPEKDSKNLDLYKEEIIDSIYCCYVSAMRNELLTGSTSTGYKQQLVALQEQMLNISNKTGHEFMKLQTGFISILISYIDRNS